MNCISSYILRWQVFNLKTIFQNAHRLEFESIASSQYLFLPLHVLILYIFHKILHNIFSPALVKTRFAENIDLPAEQMKKAMESFQKVQPLGMIMPQQISEAILFLCTSDMTTGVTLPVDGGAIHSSKT